MNTANTSQDDAEDEQWHRMPSGLPGACGFVRWGGGGVLEVELYDPTDSAHAALGTDVATHVAVETQHLPGLTQALSAHTGSAIPLDALPATLARSFDHIEDLIAWLEGSPVQVTTQPDLMI